MPYLFCIYAHLKMIDENQSLDEYFATYFSLLKKILEDNDSKELEFPKGRRYTDASIKGKKALASKEESKALKDDDSDTPHKNHPSYVNAMNTFYRLRNFVETLFTWVDSLMTVVNSEAIPLEDSSKDKFCIHKAKYWNNCSECQLSDPSFDLSNECTKCSYQNSCLIIPWILLDFESAYRNNWSIFTTKELSIPTNSFTKVSETEK